MIPLTAAMVGDVVGGDVVGGDDMGQRITGVSIDSRTTRPGDLFVPLSGDHADGHTYIPQAMAAGAVAHLCAADQAGAEDAPTGGIVVDDPLDALTGLGAWIRDQVNPIVVAITGSNGKTTTKDMAAAAIGAARVTVANPASFNNEIGLPLTLCLMTPQTEVLVCEIGARGKGHIASMMPILRPDVAIVTTVAWAHIGEFGSIEAIAEAKSELIQGLDTDGVAIVNADVPACLQMSAVAPGRVVTFGLTDAADVHAEHVEWDDAATATVHLDGVTVRLPRPGRHQVSNALAALAAAREIGVDLATAAAGLANAAMSRWRMEVSVTDRGVTLVNDAYNANPDSVIAALDTVARMQIPGRRWAVLGFMAELGDQTGAGHLLVGAELARCGFDGVVVVEARAAGIADGAREAGFDGEIVTVVDVGEAGDAISLRARQGDVVLVKASRSVGMERVAMALAAAHAGDGR